MAFFRKKHQEVEISSPKLEVELEKAIERKKEADKEFHKIKGVCGPHVLEIFIDALAKGKLKNHA